MEISPNLSEKAKYDYELVQAAIAGDQKAYAELLGKYKDMIFYMLLKMVNNKSDAEDLTIEAFGKAFKNLHNYAPNFAFSTWLFKIATNNCIDFIRRRKSSNSVHISIDTTTDKGNGSNESYIFLQSTSPDPEEKVIIQQKEKLLETVIKKLNPRYQRLIELRYFKEYSYSEISEELGLPIGTIKANLFRSRLLLLNTLKETGEKF